MTDEQIKLNAEAYADKKAETVANFQRKPVVEDFIAGAHSRDKEVEELEQALAFTEDVVDAQKKELDQLRNPWISIKDKLPEDGQKILEAYTLECTAAGNKSINEEVLVSFYRGKFVCDGKETNYGIGKSKSTTHHWMPIPKLSKGE